ncbi:hypothetical protein [Streptomyces sp. A0592]|uniref:hypothetical protein n=1 Tax=Streptomyces sp. A0592 TaxID=2563099 RepID=UPI00109EBDA2|nr:hypothetical protein [Streptomyces sp. A0592]THA75432.1 hypothetical protein E6U81_36795 [Streptomyces sp. A0592]
MADQTVIVIHPVSPRGGRKVTMRALGMDTDLGRAFTPGGVSEILRRVGQKGVWPVRGGADPAEGGGPDVWTGDI